MSTLLINFYQWRSLSKSERISQSFRYKLLSSGCQVTLSFCFGVDMLVTWGRFICGLWKFCVSWFPLEWFKIILDWIAPFHFLSLHFIWSSGFGRSLCIEFNIRCRNGMKDKFGTLEFCIKIDSALFKACLRAQSLYPALIRLQRVRLQAQPGQWKNVGSDHSRSNFTVRLPSRKV